MKLKQLRGLTSFACLIANCHGYGKYIGQLNEEVYEHGIEVWIEVTPRLLGKLCKNCGWDSCDNNPKFVKLQLEFED